MPQVKVESSTTLQKIDKGKNKSQKKDDQFTAPFDFTGDVQYVDPYEQNDQKPNLLVQIVNMTPSQIAQARRVVEQRAQQRLTEENL